MICACKCVFEVKSKEVYDVQILYSSIAKSTMRLSNVCVGNGMYQDYIAIAVYSILEGTTSWDSEPRVR